MSGNQQLNPIEIFRAGTHVDTAGVSRSFTADHLQQIASGYSEALHEAPLVVGHPRTDAPAYGWVDHLSVAGNTLLAHPKDVDTAFAEMVNKRRFPKRSTSLYEPHQQGNPTPGKFYLKHVGFLGAKPPAVKGLKDFQFEDDGESICIEFSEAATQFTLSSFFRKFRDWFIEQNGREEADKVVPSRLADDMERMANEEVQREIAENASPSFSEPVSEEDSMPEFAETDLSRLLNRRIKAVGGDRAAVIQRMASAAGIDDGTVGQILRGEIASPPERRLSGFARVLGVALQTLKDAIPAEFAEQEENDMTAEQDQRQTDLDAREAAIAEREAATRNADAATFVEGLVTAGKLPPVHKAGMTSLLTSLSGDAQIEFAEGEGTIKKPSGEFLRSYLTALPKLIEFGEHAPTEGDLPPAAATPGGFAVDPDRQELHQKALAYAESHKGVDYITAVERVSAQTGG